MSVQANSRSPVAPARRPPALARSRALQGAQAPRPRSGQAPKGAGPRAAKARGAAPRDLPDPPPTRADQGKVSARPAAGQLFQNGVGPKDVQQGAIGDCYLCAGLSSVAHANPQAIRDAITTRPDGTYDVRIFDATGKRFTVNVDGDLYRRGDGGPRYARGTDDKELWPAIFEKAYARVRGSYEAIGNGGTPGRAMQSVTGRASEGVVNARVSADALWDRVHGATQAGRPVAAGTYPWAATEYTGGAGGYQTDVDLRSGRQAGWR